MVVTGPLVVEPIVKPPQLDSEVKNAFQKLKEVGSSGNYPQQWNLDPVPNRLYNNYHKENLYESMYEKPSSKLEEMFIRLPHQQDIYVDSNISVFPLDNDRTIPNSGYHVNNTATGHAMGPAQTNKSPSSGDYYSPFSNKIDLDVETLLSFSTLPNNKQQDSLNSDLFPLDIPAATDSINLQELGKALSPLALPAASQNEPWVSVLDEQNIDSPPTEKTRDPFFPETLCKEEPRLYHESSSDSLFHDSSPLSTPQSAPSPELTNSFQDSSLWDENLQQLFEKTFDLSDIDMLPPPSKRLSDEHHQHHLLSKHPSVNSLCSEPEITVLPPTADTQFTPALKTTTDKHFEVANTSASVPSKAVPVSVSKPVGSAAPQNEPASGGRGKSTVLFGKHEDEIIHKLLVPGLTSATNKPITRDKLVSMPVEEFNHLLELAHLNDIEVAFMKEWRRRGKNKNAAQIARKRKREEVGDLEQEVEGMRQKKIELQRMYDRLRSQIASLKERSVIAENRVYEHYSVRSGTRVSRDTHLIHVTGDNKLLLVPRISSQVITVN